MIHILLDRAPGRASVPDKVLGGRQGVQALTFSCAGSCGDGLKTLDVCRGEFGHQVSILAEAFVRAPPADVLRHRHHGRKVPGDARRAHLLGGHRPDLAHQLRVTRGSQADVMRKDRGAVDVPKSVH